MSERRELRFANLFLDKLADFEKFLGRNNPATGRAFTSSLFDFCYNVIGPLPWAYPAFQDGLTLQQDVRRAVFKRHYVLLYRITNSEVKFLELFHTSQKEIGLSAFEGD